MKKDSYYIRIKRLVLLGCSLVFLFFLWGELTLPQEKLFKTQAAEEYGRSWTLVCKDGSKKELLPPCKLDGKRGEPLEIETTLPAHIEDNTLLCFYSVHQEMEFYIDGELRDSYKKNEEVSFVSYPVRLYVPLYLSQEDENKVLTVRLTGWGKNEAGSFYQVYIGSTAQVLYRLLKSNGIKFLAALALLITSIVSAILCLVFAHFTKRKIPMVWLCVAVALLMIWGIADSRLRQFIFPNTTTVVSTAYLVVFFVPIAYCIYLDQVQKLRYHKTYQAAEIFSLISFACCFVLNLLGVDFLDMSLFVYGILLASILLLGWNLAREAAGDHIREYKFVAVGIVCTFIGGIFEIQMLFFSMYKFRQMILYFSQTIFVILAAFQTVIDVRDSVRKEQEKIEEEEKAREELTSTLSEEMLPMMKNLEKDISRLLVYADSGQAEKIKTEFETTLSFFTSIRDVSSLQREVYYTESTVYRMRDFTESARSFLNVRTKGKGIRGELVVEEGLPEYLYGSRECCKHICISLIEYAVRYTSEGSVVCSICSHYREGVFYLKLSVASPDSDISPELIERVEDPQNDYVYRGDIRLLSVRFMSRKKGGWMEINSEEGAGFLITVYLPYLVPENVGEEALHLEKGIKEETQTEAKAQMEKTEPENSVREKIPAQEPGIPVSAKIVMERAEAESSGNGKAAMKKDTEEKLLDCEKGIRYCGGNQELYQEVLEVYAREGREALGRLRTYVKEEDWENYRIAVHAVKSTSLNIGAGKLSELAKEQEMAAREGRIQEVLSGWEKLLQLYEEALCEVESLLPKQMEESTDREKESNPLQKIKELLEDYEIEEALCETQKLKKQGFEPYMVLRNLENALEDFDYDEASAIIEEYERTIK